MISTPSLNGNTLPYDIVMDVTPELSFRWLEGNTLNRPVNQAHVDRLARDMKAGRWQLTHQGIAFDTDGLLADGQHRLWAVIEANLTVTLRVFFNQPPENRRVFDIGERRSNLDILSITGKVGKVTTKDLATLHAMLAGLSSYFIKMTPGEEIEQYGRHRDAVHFAVEQLGAAIHRGVATATVRAVIARAYYSAGHEQLTHFCKVLRTGMPTDGVDHGIIALRDFLIGAQRAGKGQSARRLRYTKTEWALAAFLDKKVLKRLGRSNSELFPLPAEVERRSSAAVLPPKTEGVRTPKRSNGHLH